MIYHELEKTTDFLKIGQVVTAEIALVALCRSLLSCYRAINGRFFKEKHLHIPLSSDW